MTIITIAHVQNAIADVTSEQIAKCSKIYNEQTKQWFYLVENESGKLNEAGELIEYKVQWSKEYGFTCNCDSGKFGFYNVKHPSGVCKHVRWSVAASREEYAQALVEKRTLLIAGKEATESEYERVMTAPVKKSHHNAKAYQPKPFSLMK